MPNAQALYRKQLVGHDITIKLLQPGAILGEISLLRDVACETAIASTEVTCLTFPTVEYLRLLAMYPAFAEIRQNCCHLLEIFDVVGMQKQVQALGGVNLKELAQKALAEARVHYLQPGKTPLNQLDRESIWFVSGGGTVKNYPLGSHIEFSNAPEIIEVVGTSPARLIGLRTLDLMILDNLKDTNAEILDNEIEIPYAPDEEFTPPKADRIKNKQKIKNIRIFMVTDN
jgi:ATP-binding cassette subfamily B protein